jgi:alanine racemase
MPAIKADAYGHGAVECARVLQDEGADWFGVALPEEGERLRRAGISRPILCLGGFWQGQQEICARESLTPAIFRVDQLELLASQADALGRPLEYHLKIDTGMRRLGVPIEELPAFLDAAQHFANLRLDGVMTHLASADDPDQRTFTSQQLEDFEAGVQLVRARGFTPKWIHASNGAAAHALPGSTRHFENMIRAGGVIYGLWRDVTDGTVAPLDWRPVLSLHSRIIMLKTVPAGARLGYGGTFVTRRESTIATIPIGYEDGLRRSLSNRGSVLVRGRLAAIVGRISMDLTLVDVTDSERPALGDRVTLIGSQDSAVITVEDVASQCGTLSYEVTCGISDRVPRRYIRTG